jgi:hypothetical protein
MEETVYEVGQILEFTERVGLKGECKDSVWRGVLKDGIDDRGNPCLVVYNPNCCDICKNSFGAIASLGEMLGVCDGRVTLIGNHNTNPELLTVEV